MTPQPLLLEMPKFIPPTIGEIMAMADDMGLPQIEAEKFYYFYESKGWLVGKTIMKKPAMAMAGWRSRWRERNGTTESGNVLTPVQEVKYQKEYERILARLKVLDNSYDSHQDMRPLDRAEKSKLIQRMKELRKMLAITI